MGRITLDGTMNIPISELSKAELMTLKNALTFKSFGGDKFGFGGSQEVELFEETEDGIIKFARRYAFEEMAEYVERAEDLRSVGSSINVVFDEEKQAQRPDLKLRQDKFIDAFLLNLDSPKNPMHSGLGCAPCGTGKTVCASKMISKLGQTTLVLVHKEFLMEQWIDRLMDFTDLTRQDIGVIQQDRCEYQDKKVSIAMLQSLLERNKYPEEFYSWAGVIIADEAHRMSAPGFQSVIPQFSAKTRIGLTATPRRGDGLQGVFEQHLGAVLAQMSGGNAIVPKIYQMPIDVWVPEGAYLWRQNGKIKKTFLGKLVTILAGLPKRNTWIVKEIHRASKSGRKVLLLSDRREHLDELQRLLINADPTFTVGFYVGGMTKKARKQSEDCDIILGTFAMAKEGLDICAIDTLFLGTPKSDVEQSVGRILRVHEDKKEPIVVDLVDSVPLCMQFAKKRLANYRRLGYEVVKSV